MQKELPKMLNELIAWLPVIWHSRRDEIEYKYIHELRAKESRSGKRVLYAVLADYCGHSYTVADPRQLSIKNP